MSAQTVYEINQKKGIQGQIFDLNTVDTVTGIVEGGDISFGVAVKRGGNDGQIQVGGGGASKLYGISARSLDRMADDPTGSTKYKATEAALVVRYGYLWVTCVNGCSKGDSVFVNDTTGVFRSATDTGFTEATNCKFETTAAAGELAVLRIEG